MRFVRLLWITSRPGGAWVGSVSNKHNPSKKLGLGACISSRITTVIHVEVDHQINYNCFNEPFAVSPYRSLYWDMHGLIFETSIWLLAGSTRFLRTISDRQGVKQTTTSAVTEGICTKGFVVCNEPGIDTETSAPMRGLPMRSQWQATKCSKSKLQWPILGWKASASAAVFTNPKLLSKCVHTNWSRYQQIQVTMRRHLTSKCKQLIAMC